MFVSKLTCLTYLTHLTYPSRSFVKTLIWQAEWRSCGFDARQISSLWRILYSHCKSQLISYKFDIKINNLKFSSYKSTLTSHQSQVAKYKSQNTKNRSKKSKLKIQASCYNQKSQVTSHKVTIHKSQEKSHKVTSHKFTRLKVKSHKAY